MLRRGTCCHDWTCGCLYGQAGWGVAPSGPVEEWRWAEGSDHRVGGPRTGSLSLGGLGLIIKQLCNTLPMGLGLKTGDPNFLIIKRGADSE
jgi:hypothetical protein